MRSLYFVINKIFRDPRIYNGTFPPRCVSVGYLKHAEFPATVTLALHPVLIIRYALSDKIYLQNIPGFIFSDKIKTVQSSKLYFLLHNPLVHLYISASDSKGVGNTRCF